MSRMVRFGLLGCGAMGSAIAEAFQSEAVYGRLAAVYDRDTAKAEEVAAFFKKKPMMCGSFEDLASNSEFIIEAASQEAVRDYALAAVRDGKSMLIMSVGALMDREFYRVLRSGAAEGGAEVYLPSGALAGVDGLLSASEAGIDELTLTTTKHPGGLRGVRYLQERGVDVDALREATVVYEGPADEAARLFPKNINVAAMASLAAGVTAHVRIVADPRVERNTHEIRAAGAFGELTAKTSNVPSPVNPRTSYLAALSAIAALKKITGVVKVGN